MQVLHCVDSHKDRRMTLKKNCDTHMEIIEPQNGPGWKGP